MPIDVVAIVSPAPGKEARVEEILVGLASNVYKHESDVARYQPYKQVGDNAGPEFVVIERYKDEATYQAHWATDYFQEIGKQLQAESLLAKPLNIMQLAPLSSGFDTR